MKTIKKLRAKLTSEEKRMDSESGWHPLDPKSDDYQNTMAVLTSAAQSLKEARFTARINSHDLEEFKKRAATEGLGYQTLLGSLIHKYVTGQLVDLNSAKIALKVLRKKRV